MRCGSLDAAREGERIDCDGEMTRIGGSLIFLRGMLRYVDRKLFSVLQDHQAGEEKAQAGERLTP